MPCLPQPAGPSFTRPRETAHDSAPGPPHRVPAEESQRKREGDGDYCWSSLPGTFIKASARGSSGFTALIFLLSLQLPLRATRAEGLVDPSLDRSHSQCPHCPPNGGPRAHALPRVPHGPAARTHGLAHASAQTSSEGLPLWDNMLPRKFKVLFSCL